MSHLEAFRKEVEAFLKRTNTPPTKFGVLAVKDPLFVTELRNGREPRLRTIQRVQAFIRERARAA